jgi:YVTN family beta-propeller protein
VLTLDPDGTLRDSGRAIDNPSSLPAEAGNARPNFIVGVALSSDGTRCYVPNNLTSVYTGLKGSVSVLDTVNNRVLGTVTTPGYPYAVAALTKGPKADKEIYVSSERDGVVSVIDVSDPAKPRLVRNLTTGTQPIGLLLDGEQRRLFVANAGSDTVSIIDTEKNRVVETVLLRPEQSASLPGATPTGLALSPDESRLYVTLGDMNAVALVRLDGFQGTLEGFLPTGWYPTAAVVSRDGARLFVANAKGVSVRNPNNRNAGPNDEWGQYIQNIIEGTVSLHLARPNGEQLRQQTAQALANNRISGDLKDANKNLPLPSGIKHVIYIIKENRTYDQVFGDLPQGNGDPSLCLFPRAVTPNQHALAERFVLLDNFYVCAEVSADGWCWSVSGMASENTARNSTFNYSGRGRNYDFEGQSNGTPVDLKGLPDVSRAPGGYLWDNCARHGVSFRNYGFYSAFGEGQGPDGKPLAEDNRPVKKALLQATDNNFRRYDMAYADSDLWQIYNCPSPKQLKTYGKYNAPSRFAEWKREFDAFVKKRNLPRFLMVRLPRNHTSGTRPEEPSPRAMVADNDYAVGQLVEAVSTSPYWKETAIFILEDDAQNGHDHVDAHRSPALVISPYVRRGTVDSRFFNTCSMLRTMQALLGLPPMNQYDAVAPAMTVFGPTPDNAEPYTAIRPAREIAAELNTRTAYRARDSQRLNFEQADAVPDDVLTEIIWHAVKGAQTPAPPIRYGLRFGPPPRDDD